METTNYIRKPFEVEAVQVTGANIHEVAEWCDGKVKQEGSSQFIKVKVNRALTPRQTQAYVGDWVLKSTAPNGGFKVYIDKAFTNSFERKDAVEELQVQAVV